MALFGRPHLSADDEARQKQSWAELEAGRLPLSAQERLASQAHEHVFTSDLSTRDLVAVRAAGYEPVGQAFGTSTFTLSGQRNYYANNFHPWQYGGATIAQPFVGPAVLMGGYHDGEIDCRQRALTRLRTECVALGGDGVVGVQVLRSSPVSGSYEFTVVGTAVRAVTRPAKAQTRPFVTTLSAADFGALRRGGWQPVEVVFSLARFACHGGYVAGGGLMNPLAYATGEVDGATNVVNAVREHVRERLEVQVRGARSTGMILDYLNVSVHHQHCVRQESQTDFYADADAVGNAIVRSPSFNVRAERTKLDIMPVIRLDREGTAS